jgi:hypothetical protein
MACKTFEASQLLKGKRGMKDTLHFSVHTVGERKY